MSLSLYALPFAVLIPIGVVGNSLMLTVILRSSKLRTISNIYLVAMAISGLVHSFLVLPLTCLMYLSALNPSVCKDSIIFIFLSYDASIFLTAGLAADRWLYIFRPLRYGTLITAEKTIGICAVMGLLSLGLTLLGRELSSPVPSSLLERAFNGTGGEISDAVNCVFTLLSSKVFVYILGGIFTLPNNLSMILFSSILWVARKQAMMIGVNTQQSTPENERRLGAKQRRGAMLMLASVLMLGLAWMPFVITVLVETKGLKDHEEVIKVLLSDYKYDIILGQTALINLQFASNPWFLCLMQKDFRHSISRLCRVFSGSDEAVSSAGQPLETTSGQN